VIFKQKKYLSMDKNQWRGIGIYFYAVKALNEHESPLLISLDWFKRGKNKFYEA
jgi:hypothetical protein